MAGHNPPSCHSVGSNESDTDASGANAQAPAASFEEQPNATATPVDRNEDISHRVRALIAENEALQASMSQKLANLEARIDQQDQGFEKFRADSDKKIAELRDMVRDLASDIMLLNMARRRCAGQCAHYRP